MLVIICKDVELLAWVHRSEHNMCINHIELQTGFRICLSGTTQHAAQGLRFMLLSVFVYKPFVSNVNPSSLAQQKSGTPRVLSSRTLSPQGAKVNMLTECSRNEFETSYIV